MTEEQIRQNAEEYADSMKEVRGELEWCATRDDFIAGAHSRDEEIEKLRKELDLTCKSRKYYEDKYYNREGFYHDLCERLRNPWISVEEQLPRKLRKKNYSKEVLCRTDGGTLLVSIYNYKKREWADGIYIKITHWMSIPKI